MRPSHWAEVAVAISQSDRQRLWLWLDFPQRRPQAWVDGSRLINYKASREATIVGPESALEAVALIVSSRSAQRKFSRNDRELIVARVLAGPHTDRVKLTWKMFRTALAGLLLAGAVGCGGINGSHTITPASFLLPGLGQVSPAASTNSPASTLALVQ